MLCLLHVFPLLGELGTYREADQLRFSPFPGFLLHLKHSRSLFRYFADAQAKSYRSLCSGGYRTAAGA